MRFGCSSGASYAVAAGTSAEEYYHIARVGVETFYATTWSSGNYSAYFHAFCHVVGMVNLVYQAGGQTYLVAVRAVTLGGGCNYLTLRQFSRKSLVEWLCGVGGAGNAHGLIYVCTSRKRVADTSAKAGGCSAERLYLGGVVVGLVLEIDEPFLDFAVNVDGDDDAAGVYLVGDFLVFEFTGFGADVHQ